MSLVITSTELRAICPNLIATDAKLDLLIAAIGCRVDTCLTSSYAECPDLARLIKMNTVCHFATLSDRVGQITSRKYANGAAESFNNYTNGGQGLNATEFGESILSLDSAGCINSAFPPAARQFIATAGTSGSRSTGFFFGDETGSY